MSRAQGTIEYLVIIAIVVVIALALTVLLTGFISNDNVSYNTSSAKSLVGSSGISITESAASVDGNMVLVLQRTDAESCTVESAIVDGVTYPLNNLLITGRETQVFIQNVTPCTDNKKSYSVKLVCNTSTNNLDKLSDFKEITVLCTEQLSNTNPTTIPDEPDEPTPDTTPPNITWYLPGDNYQETTTNNYQFIFSSDQDTNNCKVYINNGSWTEVDSNTTNYVPHDNNYFFDINISYFGSGNYYWDINCIDTNGLVGTTTDRNINYTAPNLVESLQTGLWFYWPLNGNADDIISGNNGTVLNGTTTTGLLGQAYQFSGSSSHIDSFSQTINIPAQFTYSVWVKDANVGGNVQRNMFSIDLNNGQSIRFLAWGPTTTGWGAFYNGVQDSGGFGPNFADGNWHNIVFAMDETSHATYFDGSLYISNGQHGTQTQYYGMFDYIGTISIGKGPSPNDFNGIIDEVAMWNRRLTSEEISTLYNNRLGVNLGN